MQRFTGSFTAGVLLAAVLLPQSAAAEDATAKPAAKSKGVEEIIVTSRRIEEDVQNVPIAITAISAELRNSNIRDLADLNGFSPNTRIDEDPSRSNGVSINIRGISPTRVDDNSLDAPIGVVLDGVYLGSLAGQKLENFDLERVEILRGPQGTLFGRNTVGGVLNVVRTRPTGEWDGKMKYTTGSNDANEIRMVGNAPIIKDKLAAKLFYTTIQNDGYINNDFTNQSMPTQDYQNYGIALLANPTEKSEILLTVEKFKDDSEGGAFLTNYNLAPGVVPKPADPREPDLSNGLLACTLAPLFGAGVPCRTSLKQPNSISTDLSNPSELETDAYTMTAHYDLTDKLRVVSVTGYRDMTEDRKYDFDGTSANHIYINRDNDFDQTSQELRLEGSFDKVKFVAGYYYWQNEFTQDWTTGGEFWGFVGALSGYSLANNVFFSPAVQALHPGKTPIQACLAKEFGAVRCDSGVPGSAFGAPPVGYGPGLVQKLYETQDASANAGFVNVDWTFAERWTLSAGVRYTDEKKDFKAGQSYLAPLSRDSVSNFPEYADLSNDWQDTSPKASIAWQFKDDVMFYASYAEGFHSGGFFGVNQNTADFVRDQYDPEEAQSYEVGMKSQWFDNRVQVNATLFRNDFKDKQESSVQVDPTTNTVATIFSNVADARYQGVEIEAQWVANDYISLWASMGYLDAEYSEFETDINPVDGITKIEDASFLYPRNAPKYTYGVGSTVSYPVGPGEGRLEWVTKYNWIDEIETSILNLDIGKVDSRDDLMSSLTYIYGNYSASVFGKNLTDEVIEVPALILPLFASGTITEGRTWGAEVTARF